MYVAPSEWSCTQTIALIKENLFCEVTRAGAWRGVNPQTGVPDLDGWTSSKAFGLVCPICCTIWCIISYPLTPPEANDISFQTSCCLEHRRYSRMKRWQIDGSILIAYSTLDYGNFDEPLLRALPPELVRREFFVHLDYYESLKESVS